jgi:hypothetical protein
MRVERFSSGTARHPANYLGGIGDVLKQKGRRGVLAHLGELASNRAV